MRREEISKLTDKFIKSGGIVKKIDIPKYKKPAKKPGPKALNQARGINIVNKDYYGGYNV